MKRIIIDTVTPWSCPIGHYECTSCEWLRNFVTEDSVSPRAKTIYVECDYQKAQAVEQYVEEYAMTVEDVVEL